MKPFEISPIEISALRKSAILLNALGALTDSYLSQREAKSLGDVCQEIADRWEIKAASEANGGEE